MRLLRLTLVVGLALGFTGLATGCDSDSDGGGTGQPDTSVQTGTELIARLVAMGPTRQISHAAPGHQLGPVPAGSAIILLFELLAATRQDDGGVVTVEMQHPTLGALSGRMSFSGVVDGRGEASVQVANGNGTGVARYEARLTLLDDERRFQLETVSETLDTLGLVEPGEVSVYEATD